MPNKEYALTMARYNLWQNDNVISAIDQLSIAEREKDRGAFFGSIQKTVSHIYWGDMIWMSRFTGSPPQKVSISESFLLANNWDKFCEDRRAFDKQLLQWAHDKSPDWFEGELTWFSGALGREITNPIKLLVIHLFNHQTHHRGQIHAMLTAAGIKTQDTDLPFMPERFREI